MVAGASLEHHHSHLLLVPVPQLKRNRLSEITALGALHQPWAPHLALHLALHQPWAPHLGSLEEHMQKPFWLQICDIKLARGIKAHGPNIWNTPLIWVVLHSSQGHKEHIQSRQGPRGRLTDMFWGPRGRRSSPRHQCIHNRGITAHPDTSAFITGA